jgi:hypothetical protein
MRFIGDTETKPLVLDNLIPLVYQNELEQSVFELPFYLTKSIGYDSTLPNAEIGGINFLDNIGFSHALILNNDIMSDKWVLFKPILYFFSQQTNIFVKDILRVRLRLTLQNPETNNYLFNKPHTDLPDHAGSYKTLVYYINDSDGDFYLFDKYYNPYEHTEEALKDIDKKIILQKTPKKGTAIYFDGHQYHAGNTPLKHQYRYVINFDFTI